MTNNNLFVKITAMLDKIKSKFKIQKDIQELEKTPFYIRLTGKLNKSVTRANIQRDLNDIAHNQTIRINARINRARLRTSLTTATREAQTQVQNNPIIVPVEVDNNGLQNVQNNLNDIQNEQQQINNHGMGLQGAIANYISWHQILTAIRQAIKKVVETITELNKKQTDLQIVTGKSNSEIQSLMRSYNTLAKDLSATTSDIADAADEWLRQGRSVKDTNELIADSTILAKVGQIETSDATKYLTSALNGFHKEASEAINIVDKLTGVDLESATSAGGLAEAMSRCANSADVAGVSMDALIGYIATVAEVTQKSDSVVGESFKTILARMGKIKLNNWIDEDGNDISGEINDIEKTLSRFNIKLRTSATEFRNFEDVIYDVGTSWDKFSSIEKNAIASAFGGVYQRENVITLFENFNRALELSEISANSAGTAYQKFEIYEISLEAATNRLTASFESLAYNPANVAFVKNLAVCASEIVTFIDETKLLQTTLTALIFTGAIRGLMFLGRRMIIARNSIANLSSAMNLVRQGSSLTGQQMNELAIIYNRCTEAQQRLILSSRNLDNELRSRILHTAGLSDEQIQATLATNGFATAEGAATTATFSLRGAFEALKVSIASNPIGLIVTALTLTVTAISAYNQSQQEAIDKAKEASEAVKSQAEELEDYTKKVIELRSELENNNITEQEATNIREELSKIQDEIIDKYGKEAEGINLVTGKLEDQIETIHELNKAKYKETYGLNKEGYDNAVKNIKEQRLMLDDERIGVYGLSAVKYKMSELLKDVGFDIYKNGRDFGVRDYTSDIYTIDKKLEEVFERTTALKEEAEKAGQTLLANDYDNILTYISSVRGDWSDKLIKDNEELYSQWLQNGSDYSDEYIDLIRAKASLEYAVEDGNAEKIAEARIKWNETYQNAVAEAEANGDTDVSKYFEKFFGDISEKYAPEVSVETEIIPTVTADTEKIKANLTATKEKIEDIFKNTDLFDKAKETLAKGEAIDFDDVLKLIEVDDSLAGKFKKTADGYKIAVDELTTAHDKYIQSTKEQLQAEIDNAEKTKSEAEKHIEEYKSKVDNLNYSAQYASGAREKQDEYNEAIKTEEQNIEQLNTTIEQNKLLLGECDSVTSDFSNTLTEVSNKTKLIKQAMTDMNDEGHISSSTYAEIVEMGGNYTKCLEIQNGKITLNVTKLKELETQEYKNEISANKLAIAELTMTAALSAGNVGVITAVSKQIQDLQERNALLELLIDEINNVSASSDPHKEAFEKEYNQRKHWLNMGKITEAQFYEWLNKANTDYFANKKKYVDEYRKYLEEFHSWEVKEAKNAYDDIVEALDNSIDKAKDKIDSGKLSLNPDEDKNVYKYYDKVVNDYDEKIAEAQKRIGYLLSNGGYENNKDEIDELYDNITNWKTEIDKIGAESKETLHDYIVQGVDDGIDEIDRNIDRGQYSLKFADDNNVYQARNEKVNLLLEKRNEFLRRRNELLADGYDITSDEVRNLNDDIEGIKDDILDIMTENFEAYYQEQIDALEKIKDENEKIRKEEELRLNIMKAQKALLDAQNNRNQLVFSGGQFSYEVDQEAVLSAMDEVKDAQQSIEDFNIDEQIDKLKDSQDKVSETVQKIFNLMWTKWTGEELPQATLPVTTSNTTDKTGENDAIYQYVRKLGSNLSYEQFSKVFPTAYSNANLGTNSVVDRMVSGTALDTNVVNNNIDNSSRVTMGDVNITVQGGTSQEMLDEFCDKLGFYIRQEFTKANYPKR